MVIEGLAKKSIVLAALSLLLIAGFGYFMGVMFPPKIQAATTPGTCLPINKGGTGCDNVELVKSFADALYPVGSILTTTTNTNPGTYLGGAWEQFGKGRTLLGVGSNDGNTDTSEGNLTAGAMNKTSAEIMGGENAHTLTVAEMPSHNHGVKYTLTNLATGTQASQVSWTGTSTSNDRS